MKIKKKDWTIQT